MPDINSGLADFDTNRAELGRQTREVWVEFNLAALSGYFIQTLLPCTRWFGAFSGCGNSCSL
jgi:hypothetical protein